VTNGVRRYLELRGAGRCAPLRDRHDSPAQSRGPFRREVTGSVGSIRVPAQSHVLGNPGGTRAAGRVERLVAHRLARAREFLVGSSRSSPGSQMTTLADGITVANAVKRRLIFRADALRETGIPEALIEAAAQSDPPGLIPFEETEGYADQPTSRQSTR
jgi:hypothetical protein